MSTAAVEGSGVSYRSEKEIAADAVWSLFHFGLLPKTSENIARAARAAGLQIADIRDADLREERGYQRTPTLNAVLEGGPSAAWALTASPKESAAQRARTAWNRLPDGPTRTCRRCGEEQPIDNFLMRSDSGTRHGTCNPCRKSLSRIRYLSVEKQHLMNTVGLRFVVTEGDNLAGLACAECGEKIVAGDEVQGHTALRHTDCGNRFAYEGGTVEIETQSIKK